MKHIGYSCIRNRNSKEICHSSQFPFKAIDPQKPKGRIGTFYAVGPAGDDFTIVERWEIEPPSKSYKRGKETQEFTDGKIVINPDWKPLGVNAIRLGLKREVNATASRIITEKYDITDQINAIVYDNETKLSSRFRAIKTVRNHAQSLKSEIDLLDTVDALDAWSEHDWPVI